MPAYAPNFTVRIKVRYHVAGANHTQLWRCTQVGVAHVNLDAAIAAIQGVYDLLSPSMFDDWGVLDVSYADINSDIFLPTTGLTALGLVATPSPVSTVKAQAISFVGRTAGGQPAKIAQFGFDVASTAGGQATDYRYTAGEDTTLDGVIALLNTYSSPLVICGSDILGITFKDYVNTKPYDKWVKKVRSGG